MKLFICLIFNVIFIQIIAQDLSYECDSNVLLITELMIDPSPSVLLPSEEFVEIYNPQDKQVDLSEYFFKDEKTIVSLSGFIEANEFLILCHEDDTALFSDYGKVLGLSRWPSLNNDQDNFSLLYKEEVIFDLSYDVDLISSIQDQEGGYSLELKSLKCSVDFESDYHYSSDVSGGTPGRANSLSSIERIEKPFELGDIPKRLDERVLSFDFSSQEQSKLKISIFDLEGRFVQDLMGLTRVYGSRNFIFQEELNYLTQHQVYVLNFEAVDEMGRYFIKNVPFCFDL